MRLDRLSGFALMPLVGASLAVAEEMPAKGIDEQTLKAAISGEGLPIDRKYLKPITYCPTAKFIISTNNDLRARDNSLGLWRRLTIIPFSRQIPEDEVIPNLADKIIQQELGVFLDWCLAGLLRLTQRGHLPAPTASMKAAKSAAIVASDPVAAWIQESEVTIDPKALIRKADAFEAFSDWRTANHMRGMDATSFWKSMGTHLTGLETSQLREGGQRHYFVNLRIGDVQPPPADEVPPV